MSCEAIKKLRDATDNIESEYGHVRGRIERLEKRVDELAAWQNKAYDSAQEARELKELVETNEKIKDLYTWVTALNKEVKDLLEWKKKTYDMHSMPENTIPSVNASELDIAKAQVIEFGIERNKYKAALEEIRHCCKRNGAAGYLGDILKIIQDALE